MALRSAMRALQRRRGLSLALGLLLLLANLALANYVASLRYFRADWTSAQIHALSPKTVEVLRRLDRPVQVTVFMTPPARFEESLYHETRELLHRFARHAPRLQIEYIDIDASPTRADLLAKQYDVNPVDLREGVVVLSSGPRHKYVPSAALAEYEVRGERQRLVAFKGEGALLEALLAVTVRKPATVCFTRDHGEAPTDSFTEAGYSQIFDEVKRDAFEARVIGARELLAGAQGCTIIVVGGPRSAFAQVELDSLDRYLRRDGRALVLLGPVLDRRATRHRSTGLEQLLARWGIQALDNVVVDRLAVPGEQPLMTWATRDGYHPTHPIGRAMAGRLTVWPLTRELRPAAPPPGRGGLEAVALVRTSADGWAESDLSSLRGDRPLRLDRAVDTPGPVSVAVAVRWRRSRIVALGTERGVLNRRLGGVAVRDYNRDLFLAALNWLAGHEARIGIGPKVPEHVQIALDEAQLGRVLLISVVALPGLALLAGIVVWRRRRR